MPLPLHSSDSLFPSFVDTLTAVESPDRPFKWPRMGRLPILPEKVMEVVTSLASQMAVPVVVTVTSLMSANASKAAFTPAAVASYPMAAVVSSSYVR
jgi:hypothetical protein